MNPPMTYEDFISQVENSMSPDSPYRIGSVKWPRGKQPHWNFQFKDMEVGKIYVLWNKSDDEYGQDSRRWETWFLTPTSIPNEDDYIVYWCYYYPKLQTSAGKVTPDGQSYGADPCSGWHYVWCGKRWKVLNDTPPLSDAFINWDILPWGGEK